VGIPSSLINGVWSNVPGPPKIPKELSPVPVSVKPRLTIVPLCPVSVSSPPKGGKFSILSPGNPSFPGSSSPPKAGNLKISSNLKSRFNLFVVVVGLLIKNRLLIEALHL
jgi:hypothetical protein